MWVEFVLGSLLCSVRFFSGYSSFHLSPKTNTSKFQFDLERTNTFKRALKNSSVLRMQTSTILQGQYSRGAASLKPVNLIHVSFFFRKILSCLHCNLTPLLSFEGCCSQERETCSSRSRALGTNGEVKCQTSSAQRGLLLLYYILPV